MSDQRERLIRRFRTRSYIASPEQAADDALEVLGLDDLDAAVERMQVASGVPNPRGKYMLRLLLAALTPEQS